jgi:hypothetical protein
MSHKPQRGNDSARQQMALLSEACPRSTLLWGGAGNALGGAGNGYALHQSFQPAPHLQREIASPRGTKGPERERRTPQIVTLWCAAGRHRAGRANKDTRTSRLREEADSASGLRSGIGPRHCLVARAAVDAFTREIGVADVAGYSSARWTTMSRASASWPWTSTGASRSRSAYTARECATSSRKMSHASATTSSSAMARSESRSDPPRFGRAAATRSIPRTRGESRSAQPERDGGTQETLFELSQAAGTQFPTRSSPPSIRSKSGRGTPSGTAATPGRSRTSSVCGVVVSAACE